MHLVSGGSGEDSAEQQRGGSAEPPPQIVRIQRIGLSATQRPLERIAQFLVGPKRECRIVDAGRDEGARPGDRRAGRGHGGPGRARFPKRGRSPRPKASR